MTNSWQSIVRLHFDFSPSSCISSPKCSLRSLRLAVLLPCSAASRGAPPTSSGQRLGIDHNPIFISQVLEFS